MSGFLFYHKFYIILFFNFFFLQSRSIPSQPTLQLFHIPHPTLCWFWSLLIEGVLCCASWVPTFRTERQIPPDVGCVHCSKPQQTCCQETANCSKKYYCLQLKPATSAKVAFLNSKYLERAC